jgi:hypothetical protein
VSPKILFILTAFVVSGCATTYQPYSYFGGGGYKDVQLGENIFKVTVEANGYTSQSKAADLALLRAAELTAQHDFRYFVVVSVADTSSGMTYQTPTTTNATVSTRGNTAYGTAQTYGGQTFFVVFPTPSLTILCFREKPDIVGPAYEASFVSRSLKTQYGIK